MLPVPLKAPRSRASGGSWGSCALPRWYIRSATMTQHHARGPPCSIATEAAGRLLDDCAALRVPHVAWGHRPYILPRDAWFLRHLHKHD